jgi:hypothetical protein
VTVQPCAKKASMAGATSSWNTTRSPAIIAGADVPAWNDAQDVNPMNGSIFRPSTAIGTSVRPCVTL